MYRIALLVLLQLATVCDGFAGVLRLTRSRPTLHTVFSTTPIGKNTKRKNTDDIVELRADVERLRQEAALRLEALNEKLILVSNKKQEISTLETTMEQEEEKIPPIIASLTAPSSSSTAHHERVNLKEAKSMEELVEIADTFERDMHILNKRKEVKSQSTNPTKTQRHPLKLLDETRWRLVLNVHRVKGTWMPKTWGASGDHLRMKLEVEFTTDELYEREAFFNGLSDGSKILRIVNNEGTLGPTMSEGGKKFRVLDGGWRVCPKEGPLGTAILRWYFDVEEQASHLGSDIYLPAGRVYGSCGYFPMIGRSDIDGRGTSKRQGCEKELREMEARYLSLKSDMESDKDWFSKDKFLRHLEMEEIKKDAKKIQRIIRDEHVKEPSKDRLRLSRDQSVGLTHEGGICCRKQNGLSQEYHILGKFEVASIENREHSEYSNLLRP